MKFPQLGFPEAVKKSFSYLETDYGFEVVEIEETIVRYESSSVFVNVYHGRASREISFEFGLKRSSSKYSSYGPGILLRTCNQTNSVEYRNFATTTIEGVVQGVSKLGTMLSELGGPALQGNINFYQVLEAESDYLVERRLVKSKAERTRPKAEEAFRSNDYKKAAELYGSIEQSLTPTELKKLAFARSKSKE